jgi:hypothetical protein
MNYFKIFCIYLFITTQALQATVQRPISNEFYISHSPYYTTGYLGAQAERRYKLFGPNPYKRDVTLSGTRHKTLAEPAYWQKKNISYNKGLL